MYLNLNVNSKDIDNWEVNIELKNQYEYFKNIHIKMQ